VQCSGGDATNVAPSAGDTAPDTETSGAMFAASGADSRPPVTAPACLRPGLDGHQAVAILPLPVGEGGVRAGPRQEGVATPRRSSTDLQTAMALSAC
jgi:hypothetical protein